MSSSAHTAVPVPAEPVAIKSAGAPLFRPARAPGSAALTPRAGSSVPVRSPAVGSRAAAPLAPDALRCCVRAPGRWASRSGRAPRARPPGAARPCSPESARAHLGPRARSAPRPRRRPAPPGPGSGPGVAAPQRPAAAPAGAQIAV